MKNNILKMTPLFFIGLTALLSSCKDKNKEDEKVTPDTKTLLTTGEWNLTSVAYKKYNTDIDSVTVEVEACEKDDITVYTTSGSIIESSGAIKCEMQEESEASTYTLSDKTMYISFPSLPGFILSFDILEISTTNLVLKNTFLGSTEIYTFKKK